MTQRSHHGGAQEYYLSDGLGSTTGVTSSSGAVTDTYAYDVFGALRSQTGASAQPFRFTGEQQDPDVNRQLYYLRARYYDPAIGRFWSRDPWPGIVGNPQSQTPYPYVENNPASLIDPYGLISCGPFGGVCDRAGDAAGAVADAGRAVSRTIERAVGVSVDFLQSNCGQFALGVAANALYFSQPELQAIGATAAVLNFTLSTPPQAKEGDWFSTALGTGGFYGNFAQSLTTNRFLGTGGFLFSAASTTQAGWNCANDVF